MLQWAEVVMEVAMEVDSAAQVPAVGDDSFMFPTSVFPPPPASVLDKHVSSQVNCFPTATIYRRMAGSEGSLSPSRYALFFGES